MGVAEDSERSALQMFENFHDKPSKRRVKMDFGWPKVLQEVGLAKAQMYRSNKWKSNSRDTEDYKHIAEAAQSCFVVPGFLRHRQGNKPLQVYGDEYEFDGEMPPYISILAPLIGIQVHLFDEQGKLKKDENLYEITVPHGMLAGANFSDTGEPFLAVYTRAEGIHMIITGSQLDVEKDGIVG